jgi:PAS domain S-box-containing protein
MMENIPLYNSIIIKGYIDYLENNYPNVSIKELLAYSNINYYELEDRGHWLTQEQVNRFQEYVERVTANPNIAREAGRYLGSSRFYASSTVRQSVAGFLSPSIAYWAVEKLGSSFSRHQTMKVNKLARNKTEIIATPCKGVKEELFQCENRIGMFEAIAEVFTHKYADVEHPECIHRGDSCCRYIISWQIVPSLLWKRIGNYLFAGSIILASAFFFFTSEIYHWLIFFLLSLLISSAALLYGYILHNREMMSNLENQGKAADQLVEQINLRYNESLLIKEIGEAASSILDPQRLLNFISESLEKRLQFNRAIIMLANPERTKLIYTIGYGYNPEQEALLTKTDFHLTNPRSKGIFYLAYRDQKPFLISNVTDIENDLSEHSYIFMKDFGVTSFICVPIVYEGKSEGILAVDNTETKTPPMQSDLSLLTGIAQQIGISLNNALAHKKTKESEERFRNLSNSSPDIIYQLDINGKFKYVNPAWEEVLGHNINEIKNKHLFDFINEKDQAAFVEIFQNILDDKLTVRDKNFVILNNKGLPRYITFTGAPDIDAEGNVMGVVGTLKDISRLRIMEAQLLQASKMEAVGTLTGGIAHDFNNIIQAIMGYNQIMISGRTGNETEISYLKSIGELIQRSRELVGQLMLFGKKVEPLSKIVNINEEISSMHNLLTKSIPKMIDVQTNLQEDIFPLIADSTQIGQIIMNLVINARDAIGDSGKILISTNNIIFQEDTSIAGLNVRSGSYIELTVSDTGSGIEKELMQHIFEPFFTTKEAGKGTGLGLTVVHGIVKNHNGFIYCESTPDKGTTFRILLPATTSGKLQQEVQEKTVKIPRGKENLLVVDDEKNILETVKETLSSYGYKVTTAGSTEQALEVYTAQKDKIKLVLLDLNMPGKGGKKCLIDLLAIDERAKVLMTSGYSTSQQIEDLTKAGAAGFINKPYRPEDLLLNVRKILDTSTSKKMA